MGIVKSVVFHTNGTFFNIDSQAEGICLDLGKDIGVAVLEKRGRDGSYTTYKMMQIMPANSSLPYLLIQSGFVLWHRQEEILADQSFSAYRSGLGLSHQLQR